MKIALVLSLPPGYSETFFNSLIKGLKSEGHDITLFTGHGTGHFDLCHHITHPPVYRFYLLQFFSMFYNGLKLLPHFRAVRRFYHLEKKEGTGLKRIIEKIYLNASLLKFKGEWIHFGFATTAINHELVAKSIGVNMAVSFRGYDINVYPLKHVHCYDLLWKHVDKVHSISKYLLDRAYGLGLKKSTRYQVIHPAVNMDILPKHLLQERQAIFKIVTVARFSWIKGLDLLTEVASILKESGLNYEWILIGAGDTSEKERYLFDVNERDLYARLKHKGKCSHIDTLNILNDCDVYVQTSLNEGFCNALLEAQAMGIPCIAFEVGGIPENIDNNNTGWLITPFDTNEMAKKIQEILHLSIDEKVKLSQNATARVRKNFGLEAQRQAFHEFYSN